MPTQPQNSSPTRAGEVTCGVALRTHWPEYCIEAAALGVFMVSACVFAVALEYPGSPVHRSLEGAAFLRHVLMGLAMGSTAVGLIRSPWGQRSGAHMNPAVTLTFLTLNKIGRWDAIFYILFQFIGGILGVRFASAAIGSPLRDSSIHYVATAPGPAGPWIALVAEFAISLVLMTTILWVSNSERLTRLTPWCAGGLVAAFIVVEAPLSGMSMNPARTFGSAFAARDWSSLWIYFLAPPAAMLLAGAIYRVQHGDRRLFCAKLHHHNNHRCIFRCRIGELHAQ